MELAELRSELENFEKRVTKTIQEKVTLKIKEEIKTEIIGSIVKQIELSNFEVKDSVNEVKDSVNEVKDSVVALDHNTSTGFLQTHNLLSNIAGILTKMEKRLDSQTDILRVIAENTKK